MNNSELFNESNRATYSPEDNKLRLYVGRVPRPEYEALRADGWTSTPKQDCDFVAHWTPGRRNTCLAYAGIIEDEDQGPEDRAADRAERFGGYLDKRLSEAGGHADRYDAGPQAHGFQSEKRAERAAARHDRVAGYACDAWSKAEYWQRRTAGVISHALYSSRPDVRMGRIKEIESEIRRIEASHKKSHAEFSIKHAVMLALVEHAEGKREKMLPFPGWQYSVCHIREADKLAEDAAFTPEQMRRCMISAVFSGEYMGRWQELRHLAQRGEIESAAVAREWLDAKGWEAPQPPDFSKSDWHQHLTLRLAYENQMLEAQGGRAAHVEMIAGGFIGGRQIQKVNKSNATGRVVSVIVRDNFASTHNHWGNPYPDGEKKVLSHTIETERLPADAYRAPTDEELAAFNAAKKAAKAAAPKKDARPLINPTDADAERLQAIWNTLKAISYEREPAKVLRITQEQYSANSKGSYARAEAKFLAAGGKEPRSHYGKQLEDAMCKVRFSSYSVIVITDKPQKPLPEGFFNDPTEARLAIVQDQARELMAIDTLLRGSMKNTSALLTPEQRELFNLARLVGYAYEDSLSQRGTSPKFYEWAKESGLYETANA